MSNQPRRQDSPIRLLHYAFFAAVLILVVNLAALSFIRDSEIKIIFTDLISALLNLVATGCLAAAAWLSFRQSKKLGLAWAGLACAQLSFTVGDIIWAVLEVGLGDAPFPSSADAFYIAYYLFFLFGVFLLPFKPTGIQERIKRLIDITIVMLAAILVVWNFLIGPLVQQGTEGELLVTLLNLAYPVGDLILLWALLVLLFNRSGNDQGSPLWFLVGAALVQIVTDYLFSYHSLLGTYVSGGLTDLGWILAYLLIALAGLSQAVLIQMGPAGEARIHKRLRFFQEIPALLPFLPYVGMCGAFGLLVLNYSYPLPMDFNTLAGGVSLIIALIVIRQVMTLSENNRLNVQLHVALDEVQQKANALSQANHELQAEIVERMNVEEQLAHDALHDGLTGLANRILFMDRLGQAIAYTRRRMDYSFSVVFLDLDQFKVINDSLGHRLGDKLLIALSQRLLMSLRTSDTVARLGGDEFVILLENTIDQHTVLATANRILGELAIPFHLDGHEVYATVSMGIVPNLLGYDRAEDVLRDADIAMYRAKELGKARFEIFNADMRMQAIARLQLENELRHAIEEHEFEVYYQPIYGLETMQLIGFETLLRWNHPARGLLRPLEFIQVVEETGLIQPLGKWVLQEACAHLREWHTHFPQMSHLSVNVNVSGKQLTQPNFADLIVQTLAETGLNPNALNLEITESVFMIDSSATSGFFAQLSQLGIRFQIDDFGTGYSSLSYLQRFPIHTIKIDKSFIQKIGKDGKSHELIRAIISMARDLGMATTAEGVESQSQLRELKKLNCTNGQGYLLGRPMPMADMTALLTGLARASGETGPATAPAAI